MRCLFCGYDNAVDGGAKRGERHFWWQWNWRCSCGFSWDEEYEYGQLTYGFGTEPHSKQIQVEEGLMAVFGEVS